MKWSSLLFSRNFLLENQRVKLIPATLEHLNSLMRDGTDPAVWQYQFEFQTTSEAGFREYYLDAMER